MLPIPRIRSFLCFNLKRSLLNIQSAGIVILFFDIVGYIKMAKPLEHIFILMAFEREYIFYVFVEYQTKFTREMFFTISLFWH